MKRAGLCLTLSCCLASVVLGDEPDRRASDRAAIEKAVESYVEAFNRGDAKAVAAHWSDSGEYLTPAGERLQGRGAIEKSFLTFFADHKGSHVEVAPPAVRFISADVAVEEGSARLVRAGEEPTDTTYLAIHVRQGGQWKMDSVREVDLPTPTTGPQYDQLKDLEWMIGEWIDQDEHSTIETVCRWTKNKTFLTRTFKVSVPGMDDLEGTQVVGWDPIHKALRSWTFDSDGGYLDGVWTRNGESWVVKSSGFLAGGSRTSSVNVYQYVDSNTFTWRAFGREVNGEFMPDIAEVKVVRKPAAK